MNVQEANTSGNPPSNRTVRSVKSTATRGEKRLAFNVAMRNGSTIAEASRIAGISRTSGNSWAKQFRAAEGLQRERDAIASKTEVAERLTALMRDPEVPPPYQVQAAAQHSRLMGYDAPSRSQIEVRSVPASVESWMQSCLTIDVATEPDIQRVTGQNEPLKALTDKASSE